MNIWENIIYILGTSEKYQKKRKISGRLFVQILFQYAIRYFDIRFDNNILKASKKEIWTCSISARIMNNCGKLLSDPHAQFTRRKKLVHQCSFIGPKLFRKSGLKITRTEVELTNKRGHKLICSHYEPYVRPCKQLPCVIYLHGNSSCQIEA